MKNHLQSVIACLCALFLIAGCATPQPVPFQLVDPASAVQKGTIFPANQRIEVTIDGQYYKGFYLLANGSAYSETYGGWRLGPRTSMTTYYSNSARAKLTSDNGKYLSCEFLIEGNRAIGQCKTPAGVAYQLSTE